NTQIRFRNAKTRIAEKPAFMGLGELIRLFVGTAQHRHVFGSYDPAAKETLCIGQPHVAAAENKYLHGPKDIPCRREFVGLTAVRPTTSRRHGTGQSLMNRSILVCPALLISRK